MTLSIPKLSLIVLIGSSGAGKSTFARKHFLPTEIVSSDACRAMVSDDENNLNVTREAFDLVHTIAAKRLALGKLTVIDATSVQQEARAPLVSLARKFHCLPVAIVLNLPEEVCQERNRQRPDRSFGPHVIRNQRMQLRRSLKGLKREGFRNITILETPEEVESVVVERVPLWNDKSHEHGPFDIIGDVHGCTDELEQLLEKLGYTRIRKPDDDAVWHNEVYTHPNGRRAVFVGDIVDRGPRVVDSLRIVRNMVVAGSAFCVPGNHDMKLLKKLNGREVQITHGLGQTLAEIEALPTAVRDVFVPELAKFLEAMVSHYVFDGGKLVVAHAGLKQEMQGRGSAKVRDFCLYGETTGETDEFGLPVRLNWAAEYRGQATVVYGHTPVPEAEWLNNTVDVDTGCVFGGKLTALRWPEREFVALPALRTYCEPARPFLKPNLFTAQQELDNLLDAEDVLGKRIISTGLRGNVIIREANATAALEVMSRFAADPRWLIYLPPTMSPCETSSEPGLLEHPAEAFAYYRKQGAARVICEEKHMGSRAVVVVCRDETAARERFGIDTGEVGIITTRTGRRFFHDAHVERQLLDRLRAAITMADLWNTLNTAWFCFDCELMPWSAKAQELLRNQYAAVGSAGRAATPLVVQSLATAGARLLDEEKTKLDAVAERMTAQASAIDKFVGAYRQYCWPVNSIEDYKLAPFHLMASEGQVHTDKPHAWHMDTLAKVCLADPAILLTTKYKIIDVNDATSEAEGIVWWTEMTSKGGEGMVVKPYDFVFRGEKGLAQPAVKCRGPEYLRIIYGPDYDAEANLVRLRKRGLGHKRLLAISEFALGLEALTRFVRRDPLRRVHECVFGVLALESEPVDPRL